MDPGASAPSQTVSNSSLTVPDSLTLTAAPDSLTVVLTSFPSTHSLIGEAAGLFIKYQD